MGPLNGVYAKGVRCWAGPSCTRWRGTITKVQTAAEVVQLGEAQSWSGGGRGFVEDVAHARFSYKRVSNATERDGGKAYLDAILCEGHKIVRKLPGLRTGI